MDVADAFFGADVITHQPSRDSMDGMEETEGEIDGIMKIEAIWKETPTDNEMVLPSVEAFAQKHMNNSLSLPFHKSSVENFVQKSESIHHHHHETMTSPAPTASTSSSLDLDQIIFYSQSTSIAQTETAQEIIGNNIDEREDQPTLVRTSSPNIPSHPTNQSISEIDDHGRIERSPSTTAENSPNPAQFSIVEKEGRGNDIHERDEDLSREELLSPSSQWMSGREERGGFISPLRASDDSEQHLLVPLRKLEVNLEEAKLEQSKQSLKSKDRAKSAPRTSTVSVHRSRMESPTQLMIQSKPALSTRSPPSSSASVSNQAVMASLHQRSTNGFSGGGVTPNLNFIPLMALGEVMRSKTPSPKNKPPSNSPSRSVSPSITPRKSPSSAKTPSSAGRPTSPALTRSTPQVAFSSSGRVNHVNRAVSPSITKTVPVLYNKGNASSTTSVTSASSNSASFQTPQTKPKGTVVDRAALPGVGLNGASRQVAAIDSVQSMNTGSTSSSGSTNKDGVSILSSLSSSASHPDLVQLSLPLDESIPTPVIHRAEESIKEVTATATTNDVKKGNVGDATMESGKLITVRRSAVPLPPSASGTTTGKAAKSMSGGSVVTTSAAGGARRASTGGVAAVGSVVNRSVSSDDMWPASGRVRHIVGTPGSTTTTAASKKISPNKQPAKNTSPSKRWK